MMIHMTTHLERPRSLEPSTSMSTVPQPGMFLLEPYLQLGTTPLPIFYQNKPRLHVTQRLSQEAMSLKFSDLLLGTEEFGWLYGKSGKVFTKLKLKSSITLKLILFTYLINHNVLSYGYICYSKGVHKAQGGRFFHRIFSSCCHDRIGLLLLPETILGLIREKHGGTLFFTYTNIFDYTIPKL